LRRDCDGKSSKANSTKPPILHTKPNIDTPFAHNTTLHFTAPNTIHYIAYTSIRTRVVIEYDDLVDEIAVLILNLTHDASHVLVALVRGQSSGEELAYRGLVGGV
jgi:hypothetical protein